MSSNRIALETDPIGYYMQDLNSAQQACVETVVESIQKQDDEPDISIVRELAITALFDKVDDKERKPIDITRVALAALLKAGVVQSTPKGE